MSEYNSLRVFTIEEGNHAGRIGIRSPATAHKRIETIPGALWDSKTQSYAVPKAWPAVLSIGSLAKLLDYKVIPSEELGAWVQARAREWKELSANSKRMTGAPKAEGQSYYSHQLDGAHWLLTDSEERGRLLLDETGAGKTGTVIAALQLGKIRGPVLIVCPEAVMTTGWFDGINTFAPEYRAVVIDGTPVKRRKLIEQVKAGEYDIAIIGMTNLKSHTRFEAFHGHALRRCTKHGGPRLTTGAKDADGNVIPTIDPETGKEIKEVTATQCQAHPKELNEIPWEVVVVDEIHRAMNARSQTTQAIWGVARYAPSEPRRWGLTGTPISTQTEQAWAPLHFINPEAWPVKSSWKDWYCEIGWNNWGILEVKGIKPERFKEFHATYSAVTRRVLKQEVLDLPPILRWGSLVREGSMGKEQREVYNSMRDEMEIQVAEGRLTARTALSKGGRLTMLATGTGYPDPNNVQGETQKMLLRMPSWKATEICQEFGDGDYDGIQVGMLFESRMALRMMEEEFYRTGVLSPDDVAVIAGDMDKQDRVFSQRDFQAGRKRVIMLTYAAGGTGITLTAASTVLVVQRAWSPINAKQGVDRFHRIGSERHEAITFIDYVTKNTIEKRQLEKAEANAALQNEITQDDEKLAALEANASQEALEMIAKPDDD